MKAETRRDYKVGYGRPPEHTRFRKGQSGNPGGRRKEARRRIDEIVREEAFRLVRVREGDEVREMTTIEAVLRSQTQLAVKGNGSAQRAILASWLAMEAREDAEQRAVTRELLEAAVEYRQRIGAERARLAQLGLEPAPDAPHPDDVQIDLHTGAVYFNHPDFSEARRPHRCLPALASVIPLDEIDDEAEVENEAREEQS